MNVTTKKYRIVIHKNSQNAINSFCSQTMAMFLTCCFCLDCCFRALHRWRIRSLVSSTFRCGSFYVFSTSLTTAGDCSGGYWITIRREQQLHIQDLGRLHRVQGLLFQCSIARLPENYAAHLKSFVGIQEGMGKLSAEEWRDICGDRPNCCDFSWSQRPEEESSKDGVCKCGRKPRIHATIDSVGYRRRDTKGF